MNSFLSEYLSKYMRGVNSIEKYIKEKYAYQRIYDIYKSEFGGKSSGYINCIE